MVKKEKIVRKPEEKDRKNAVVDKMAIDLLWTKNETLNPETGKDWTNDELAELFQIHPVTVSRKLALAKEAGVDYRKGMISILSRVALKPDGNQPEPQSVSQHHSQPSRQQVAVSPGGQRGGMDLVPKAPLPVPTQNPLDFINDFTQLAQTTVAAGSIPGAALICIGEAFNQQSTLSREERYGMLAKGVLSITGLAFGMYETVNELNKKKERDQNSIDVTPGR